MGKIATPLLAKRLRGDVDSGVRGRGQEYFDSDLVDLDEADAGWVAATVRGRHPYDVTLYHDARRGTLKVACTCPYLMGNWEPCKHVWATVLEAQKRGLLSAAAEDSALRLEIDQAVDPDWNGLDEDDDGIDDWNEPPAPRRAPTRPAARRAPSNAWHQQLALVSKAMRLQSEADERPWPLDRQVVYVLDLPATRSSGNLVLDVQCRDRRRDGEWGEPRSRRIERDFVSRLPDEADRRIIEQLVGADRPHDPSSYRYAYDPDGHSIATRYALPCSMHGAVLEAVCRTGRCMLRPDLNVLQPLEWDDGAPWQGRVEIAETPKVFTITGSLCRGDRRMSLDEPAVISAGGVFVAGGRAAALDAPGGIAWILMLRQTGSVKVPAGSAAELLEAMASLPAIPGLKLPPSLHYDESVVTPRPHLVVARLTGYGWKNRLSATVSFDYEGEIVARGDPRPGIFLAAARRLLRRNGEFEAAAIDTLRAAGFRDPSQYVSRERAGELQIARKDLPGAVRGLLAGGWHVTAEGRVHRQASAVLVEVKTGIDWFDVGGDATFDGQSAALPELIRALRKGEKTVRLGDGSVGVLPEEWLARYAPLGRLGRLEQDGVRFSRSQTGLLDALIEALPEARTDELFERARRELRRFEGVKPAAAPRTFKGALRGYQREGLGWMHFLRQFGFGGCLADDMGLGKTVQVLALLESRRVLRAAGSRGARTNGHARADRPAPSLVVVPRSLVFNWISEAGRFTPRLRVLDHTGPLRIQSADHFDDHDVVLTTYGTLRRDIAFLQAFHFDFVILDEAQAIKNAGTQAAKAARLLEADHRVALSGTPIENHLGELWSLFDFLNPGLLGGNRAWAARDLRNPDEQTRQLLGRALRPFILRRTKEQVAPDLPEKVQQTVYCDLGSAERRRYDELRQHYRQSLLPRVAAHGVARSTMHVLEALLRLRQAACHPGLLDAGRSADTSAKLEVLLPQLAEVAGEGHKALVFSQFTSLLAIVRQRLDAAGVCYEYLDGRTRKRGARVDRFQGDPDCRVFLISLKAGGLGLNLTAADYVFLLDPWWNPAVEAQAIDRTHRIGQTRRVFAYRLIARDTVEEKVLELQESKRQIADAILSADKSLIRNLTREDLEHLLS